MKTANGTSLPYEDWVEVDCKLIGTDHNYGVKIPFLVSKDVLDLPIIGYNVIKKITQNSVDNFEQPPYLDVLSSSFVGVDRGNIEALVDFIKAEKPTELSEIKTTMKDTVISPNQSVRASCHVSIGPIAERIPVLFEPNPKWPWPDGLEVPETLTTVSTGSRVNIQVNNPTKHLIILRKRMVLGRIQLVKSVTPLKVKQVTTTNEQKYECEHSEKQTTTDITSPVHEEKKTEKQTFIKDKATYIPNVDLEGLTAEQNILVQEMLREECESFSKDGEIGDAKGLQININLTDTIPVQKTYTAVPRPLYPE